MFEYASVSASAYDTTCSSAKLNEQATAGWEVVTIVPTGGDVTAFLKREAADDSSTNGDTAACRRDRRRRRAVAAVGGPSRRRSPSRSPRRSPPETHRRHRTPRSSKPPPSSRAPACPGRRPVSSVPAGWHPDPSNRYEMRYWDGEKWTEYVSSQGQTYTDPPVA